MANETVVTVNGDPYRLGTSGSWQKLSRGVWVRVLSKGKQTWLDRIAEDAEYISALEAEVTKMTPGLSYVQSRIGTYGNERA